MVSRLHEELGRSDPRGMIESLRRKHAHGLIITTAKSSACEESQRRRLRPIAARVLHDSSTCLQVDQFEWKHPVLNSHVLGTIMVDAGSRATSVTIHRVVDTEHGLGNVTRNIMLNTLLNHWIKYLTNQTLSDAIQKELFEIRVFDVVLLPRVSVLTVIPGTRPGNLECLGKHWIPSDLVTVPQFKNVLLLTMTYIEIDDFLRGSCCWERHRQTS